MSSPVKQFYEFGPYLLDASERVLLRGEETVRLTPKEFDTLLALLRGGGRVIRKEELLKEIWPDTFVGEATLAQNVFTLRKALGEAEGGKPYIETVPRRGYRFAAKVRERREEETTGGTDASTDESHAFVNVETASRRLLDADARRVETADDNAVEDSSVVAESAASNGHAALAPPVSTFDAPTAPLSSTSAAFSSTSEARARSLHEAAGRPVRAAILISVAAVLVVAAVVYVVLRLSVRPETEADRRAHAFQSMKVQRLPVTGEVSEAVISPDGKYLAYAASEPGAQSMSVWVRQVEAASNIQQIVRPAEGTFYGALVFSPDSQRVYFGAARQGDQPPALFRVPVFGGPAEKILERFDGPGPVTFSPDGKRVAFVRGHFGEELSLVVANADGSGDERTIVTRKSPTLFGTPAWSPDGKTIACVYGSAESQNSSAPSVGVTSFSADDGAETKVTEGRWVGVGQLAWLPDSAGLVLSAAEQELSPAQIWQLSYPSGEVRRVTNDLNTYRGASLNADGSALVTVQTDRVPNIWVAPAGDASRARQVTTGTGKFDGYYGVSWTPDGRIVYASIASGSWDIWLMNADGSGQRQLTVNAKSNYGPSVSADGRYVVFISNRAGGSFNVWRMDADGSNPKQLTFGKGENFAHATPDGRWVVYATVGFGEPNAVWKVPFDGGEPVRLTDDKPASWPFVSPDGKSFVCTYGGGNGYASQLAVFPIEGGQPTKLFDTAPSFRANTVWLPDNRGIAFLDSRAGTINVWMQPLGGGKPVQLSDFKADNVTAYDWSRDNRLAATRSVETTGVVLIRNFR